MHKPKPVQENEMQTIFRDFEIQPDHVIVVKRPSFHYWKKEHGSRF